MDKGIFGTDAGVGLLRSQGETIEDWRQFFEVWSNIFDREFAHKFRSEDARQFKGNSWKVGMSYWLEQQQLLEGVSKKLDLPICNQGDESQI
ncbi:hypothetical protein FM036_30880 [Nostoc sp. HG1]|nr:hypothetical protein [Nostoc sp. HG1]